MIEKGNKAPDFSLQNQYGQKVTLSELYGHKICLCFFADMERLDDQVYAITYAKEYAWFQSLGVQVLGVCGSNVEMLQAQSKRLFLPYPLLADSDGIVRKTYEALHWKTVFGKRRMITSRCIFIIDEQGVIKRIYKRVNIESSVYKALEDLQHWHDKDEWRKLSRRTKERIRREQAKKEQEEQQETMQKKTSRYIIT